MMGADGDRNFDEIAEHFAQKVYGGLKGQIRLAVLEQDITDYLSKTTAPLWVLDIGAGLAQMSLFLATQGHHCTINDISVAMLNKAQTRARELGIDEQITWLACPYQDLLGQLAGQQYDMILCHAVLEWLENPQQIIATIHSLLKKDGILSLCFYNPSAPVYRNLIMGNFNYLKNPKPADKGSLTPNHPVAYETVKEWLDNYQIITESGIRTFYDYTVHKRGGLVDTQAVIEMELKYARQMPFRLMGRYLHILAKKVCD